MKLIIQTQHEENYGAHTWDGEGECPQYWKFKGGNTYVVRDLSVNDALAVTLLIATLRPLIESDSESFKEYILDYSVVDDCEGDGVEEWEKPWVISTSGEGEFVASRFNDMYAHDFNESYTMLEGGERTDYTSVRIEQCQS